MTRSLATPPSRKSISVFANYIGSWCSSGLLSFNGMELDKLQMPHPVEGAGPWLC